MLTIPEQALTYSQGQADLLISFIRKFLKIFNLLLPLKFLVFPQALDVPNDLSSLKIDLHQLSNLLYHCLFFLCL
jgi:hypothetical protein